ncbi:hypothetical protein SDC9_182596 [bioreactor metagenome]|uniref:Uncharacterized protein n=1 Tax=bioreactor metagenome TaxID=1076179 RepID=A0A645H7U7_9ZZZZ
MLGRFLFDTAVHHFADVGIALVRDDALGVVIQLFFAVGNVGFQMLYQCVVQCQLLQHFFVPLKQLNGIPAQALGAYAVGNRLFNMRDSVFHTAGKHVRGLAQFCGFGNFDRLFCGGNAAFPF